MWSVLHEIQKLLQDHYEEIAERKDIIGKLDPDYSRYAALEQNKVLHILTARDDGKLIGYYIALIFPMLHYKTIVHSADDIHFIHPQYRKGSLGVRLFLEAEKMIKQYKALLTFVRVKVAHDHGALLERLGYKVVEKLYGKGLI